MKLYNLKTEQYIDHSIEKVFEFFSRPDNLSVITPEKMHFKIITPLPLQMGKGKIIDYTIKVFIFFTIRWRSIISSYDVPNEFTDEQLLGPYAFWHHQHHFKMHIEGTLMSDTVTYAMPYGWLGRLIHWVSVKNQLQWIFHFRAKKLEEIFAESTQNGDKQ